MKNKNSNQSNQPNDSDRLNQNFLNPKGKAKAAAIKYDGTNTPKLVAKGEGEIAKEIVSIAQQHDVHIHYDPLLLDVLSRLEMGDEIPETLYVAVAKIIAFAYYLQGKHPEKKASKKTDSKLSLSNKSKQKPKQLQSESSSLAKNMSKNKN